MGEPSASVSAGPASPVATAHAEGARRPGPAAMKLRHLQTLMPPADGLCRVTSLCFSPNNLRLAVVTVERVIHLFDEDGKRRDKFSTKPAEKVRAQASWGRVARASVRRLDSCGRGPAQQANVRATIAPLRRQGGPAARFPPACVAPYPSSFTPVPETRAADWAQDVHGDRNGLFARFDDARRCPVRQHGLCVQARPRLGG